MDAENLLVRFEGEENPCRIFDSSDIDGSSLPFAELRRIHKFIGGSAVLGLDGKPTGNPSKRNVVESIREELLDESFDDRCFGSELVHLLDGGGTYSSSIDPQDQSGENNGGGESSDESNDDGTDGGDADGADESNDGESSGESSGSGDGGDDSEDGEESSDESDGDGESDSEEMRELSPIEEQIKDMIDEFGGDAELTKIEFVKLLERKMRFSNLRF